MRHSKPGNRRPSSGATASSPLPGGEITAITSQQHDPNRVSIFLDGEFAIGLSRELAAREGLAVGMRLTAERAAEIAAREEVGKATDRAIALLARRPRSVREVRDRLRQKGFTDATIDAAIEKLEGWDYVDDEDFARYWVENRETHKPRGRRLLEQELRQKGVARDVIQETLDEADLDERGSAVDLARAKLRSYGSLDPALARRRLGAYLGRKGYDFSTIRAALNTVLDGDEDEIEAE
jgi:regulatory protein